MKYAVIVARMLLSLVFLFFGANLIFGFLQMSTPSGDAGAFRSALNIAGYMKAVGWVQLLGGLLLLVRRLVPLGLTILGPVIVNIFLYHALMSPQGLGLAAFCVLLELFLLCAYRTAFAGIFGLS